MTGFVPTMTFERLVWLSVPIVGKRRARPTLTAQAGIFA